MKKTVKKIVSFSLAIFIVAAIPFAGLETTNLFDAFTIRAEAANEYTEGNYMYTVDDNGDATITSSASSLSGDVTVPSKLGGHKVIAIGDKAFYLRSKITSITVPDTITTIGYHAFGYCSNLVKIDMGNNLTSIGDSAFDECEKLETVIIPNSVSYIGKSAFSYCLNLSEINLPDSLEKIEYQTFYYCASLSNITIPYGVTGIGARAFFECVSLENVIIPETATFIDTAAFSGCKSLKNIVIPNGTNYIGLSAFANCSSLENISISDTVKTISDSAFKGCVSLETLIIPDSVTSIGIEMCSSCRSLSKVVIGDGVTDIPDKAFQGCTGLNEIVIGNSVETIYEYAFKNCINLDSVVLGSSVTALDSDVFNGCENLEYVHIPAETTFIGDWILYDCGDAHICSETNDCYAKTYCAKKGYKFKTCDGHHVHDYISEITVQPTCYGYGVETYKCTCGDSYEKTLAPSHTPFEWYIVSEPTVDVDGKAIVECEVCWDVIGEKIIPALAKIDTMNESLIIKPNVMTIPYGDSSLIKLDSSFDVPENGYVCWYISNGHFKIVSTDNETCLITPKSSGVSEVYVIILDEDFNEIARDKQEMESEADFFNKIIGFFKKLFGLTEIYN